MIKQLLTLSLCLGIIDLIIAQDTAPLSLTNGTFEIELDVDKQLSSDEVKSWPSYGAKFLGLVKLSQYPSPAQTKVLIEAGVQILDYYPKGFYSVSIDKVANLSSLTGFGVEAHSPFKAEYKLGLDINSIPARAVAKDDKVLVNLLHFKHIDHERFLGWLANNEFDIIGDKVSYDFITVSVDPDEIMALAGIAAVERVSWVYDNGVPENYTGRTSHRTNVISYGNSYGLGYSGEGVNVMLQDDGGIGTHIDHHGRVAMQFYPAEGGTHGDHVGGTIAGSGNLDPTVEGQARGADLYVYKAADADPNWNYQGFDSVYNHYDAYDVVISSTSYSNGCNAGYTAFARLMDAQVYDLPSMMHVFSAGNSGTSNCGYGAGSVWGNVTGGHKIGKNVITVANLTGTDVISTSSSRGPAHDGRIKPDISAKGTQVRSTISNNEYDIYSGTSMSCPGVSGTLAVLYEAYEDVHGEKPNSGLIKATVLNTADDLGNDGPDFIHGWGRINARKAFEAFESSQWVLDSLGDGDSATLTINVPSGLENARFMLYWVDPEASAGASTALINDLDLTVTDPNSGVKFPYLLDHTPNATTLALPAINGADHLNNMEQVEFDSPTAGDYTLKIKGYDVPMGPQKFYVVYWFEEPAITLTYPVGGESFFPQGSELIRWDSPLDSGAVLLEYSTDAGATWTTISSSTSISQKYYTWTPPAVAEGDVQIRISQGSASDQSDNFSIMAVSSVLDVAFACPDSIGLTWSNINTALSYDVYKLGNKYMDSIGTSTTTEFVDYLSNPYDDMLWYSVSSDGPDGAKSKRKIAVKKTPGLTNCFLPIDLEVTSVLPSSTSLFACESDSQSVAMIVTNTGNSPVASVDAEVKLGGTVMASETFSINLAPLASDTLTFSSGILLSPGVNEYTYKIDLTNDANPYNDSSIATYALDERSQFQAFWSESFDSYQSCFTDANCELGVCELDTTWKNEENQVIDDIDFRVNQGGTPSQFTGPSSDHTSGGGKYLYLEASGGCTGQEALLISPCINLTGDVQPIISFWFHMYGANMGSLHMDVFDGANWTNDVMPVISGDQGNVWNIEEVDLSAFAGMTINIRFRGITGADYSSDIAIDDILLYHPPIADFEYETLPGQTVLFTDESYYGDTMSFDLGNGVVMGSVPASYTYSQVSAYTVTQIVSNPIGSDTAVREINNLGTIETSEGQVLVFPNPASEVLHFMLPPTHQVERIVLLTTDGRVIHTVIPSRSTQVQMSVGSLANGTYLLEFVGNERYSMPVIIRH
ncbi:MAG: S8 family serine peptidase [Flavobacteriales bacterium]|jgi:hypothetical protein|nr:S8 family serine peptidase [Flavobacteriales bacterium]MBT3963983.1 S8 family serine peptidase [Flavobacteriales bacterium]MBT4703910.1 S8 family serine peptidase [Flavobacteriales bacterium]MBT4931035.1 S8 family serine peptidase [Flavobacteriales bacterium]MBT5133557.1 S8 family serine peptidase [Flavobacteriales bacterium]